MADIEIAQNHTPQKIVDIAKKLGLCEDELILYGKYKAKIEKQFEPRKNRRATEKQLFQSGLLMRYLNKAKVCALLFASHHSVLCLESRVAQQAAGIVKLFQWRT